MTTFTAAAALVLASTVTAKPLSDPTSLKRDAAAADARSIAIITAIAPTSSTCEGAPAVGECVTAADAVLPMVAAFNKYKIATPGEQAALIAYMAYESGDFKFNRNKFPAPGRPGQGTRSMMMPEFVAEYAATLDPKIENADPAARLDAVLKAPGGEWGAAMWFYNNKCSADVKTGVKSGSAVGWHKYLTECVGTSAVMARDEYWTRAKTALGMKA